MTDDRTKFNQNVAIDFSNALPSNGDVHRIAHNILSPQQTSHNHHLHQQHILNHYQAAVAVAQQSLHHASTHNFFDTNNLEHRSSLYSEIYHQNQQQTQALAKSLYPKLHEDILNSSKQYQQYYQTTRLLTDSVLAKYPPLGNLCKTVSQIGQTSTTSPNSINGTNNNKLVSPSRSESTSNKKSLKRNISQLENLPSTGSVSSDSTSATVSTSSSVSNENLMVTKTHQSNSMDSGMESSDDTKSETGSTKDENGSQLWPAWIYCTRYSDRPSSGKKNFKYIFRCNATCRFLFDLFHSFIIKFGDNKRNDIL